MTRIVGCATVRESDGLALSSRNAYLTEEQRRQAAGLSAALRATVRAAREGESDCARLKELASRPIRRIPGCRLDYVEIAEARTLAPLRRLSGAGRILLAARLGPTRLIDNMRITT